jgi:kinesin family protein 4/21/27
MEEGKNLETAPESSSVCVAVRVRPLVAAERVQGQALVTTVLPDQNVLILGRDREFVFDKVFGTDSHQVEIYEACAKHLVSSCLAGYNATVLAYGQTGSGKTFTMGSSQRLNVLEEDLGIIPRVIGNIFEEVTQRKDKAEFLLKVSFLEIYNEEIHDLLDPVLMAHEKTITIREDKGSISLMGLHEQKVDTYYEMLECLDRGSLKRSTSATLMNATSSRSHAIFTISIEQHILEDAGDERPETEEQEYTTAKFHFVDLAGSERAKRTGAVGATLKEGININKGLLCLGNVISALTEDSKKNVHVPYRDSKLTRILQDSLGGNSKTYMIACVSPAEINLEETLNTLKYASRARHIKNKPIVNRDPTSAVLAQLRQEVYGLKQEIKQYQRLISLDGSSDLKESLMLVKQSELDGEEEFKRAKVREQQLEHKVSALSSELEMARSHLASAEISAMTSKRERDISKAHLEQAMDLLEKNGLRLDVETGNKLVEEYVETIERQRLELKDKEAFIIQINKEYEALLKTSERDDKLLRLKTEELQKLRRNVRDKPTDNFEDGILKSMDNYGRLFAETVLANMAQSQEERPAEELRTEESGSDEEVNEEPDEADLEAEARLNAQEEELKHIEGSITEKEDLLRTIEGSFKEMQTALMSELSEQYHHKIQELEGELRNVHSEREQALEKLKEAPSSEKQTVNERYRVKITQLEERLKMNKAKDRDQTSMMKMVEKQKQQITRLNEEIKRSKQQKVMMTKKLKAEADKYMVWKTTKQREMLQAKRISLKKDQQIMKLVSENKKKELIMRRRAEELAALQRRQRDITDKRRRPVDTLKLKEWVSQFAEVCLEEKEVIDGLKDARLQKLEIDEEIKALIETLTNVSLDIEKDRLELDGPDLPANEKELQDRISANSLELKSLNEQLEVLDERLKIKEQKVEQFALQLVDSRVDNIKARSLTIKTLYEAQQLISLLFDELMEQAAKGKQARLKMEEQGSLLEDLQKTYSRSEQDRRAVELNYEQQISRHRQEFAEREKVWVRELEERSVAAESTAPSEDNSDRIEELERQVKEGQDLAGKLRRNCEILTAKCNSLRKAAAEPEKPTEERPRSSNLTKLSIARDQLKKKAKAEEVAQEEEKRPRKGTGTSSRKSLEVDSPVWDRLSSGSQSRRKAEGEDIFRPQQKWKSAQCLDAHTGSIYSLAVHENILYSSSNRTFKVWSLETMQNISEVPAHQSFIKSMVVWPENSLIITACQNIVSVWDSISLHNVAVLKGHKDVIRAIYMHENLLITAGKSNGGAGSILMWDLRRSQK